MLYSRWKKERHRVEFNPPSQKSGGKKETTEVIARLVSSGGYRYEELSWWICVQTAPQKSVEKRPRKKIIQL